MNVKRTSFSKLAFNGQFPQVCPNDVFNDCQAESGAALLATSGFVSPVESFPKMRQVLAGYSTPLVPNRYDHLAFPTGNDDLDGTGRRRVFYRVVD